MSSVHRRLWSAASVSLTASLAAPLPAIEIGPEPPAPTPSFGLTYRKDTDHERPAPQPAKSLETLASLVNLHSGEIVPLSSSEPTEERFSELLEDRVTKSRVRMDPALLRLLRTLAAALTGARAPAHSGARPPTGIAASTPLIRK